MISLELIEALPLFYRQTIPESYLDVMGHMNVRWYAALYDEAVYRFFDSFGMSLAYFKENDAGAFALRQFLHYLAEVRADETVAIRTRILDRSARRIHFIHFMINESSGVLASTQESLGAHADMRVRRTSPFPSAIAQRFDAMLAEHNQLPWAAPLSGAISL